MESSKKMENLKFLFGKVCKQAKFNFDLTCVFYFFKGRRLSVSCDYQLGSGETFTSCLFRKEIPQEFVSIEGH